MALWSRRGRRLAWAGMRFGWHYARGFWKPGGVPLRIGHEVTHRCNLRCVFCGIPVNAADDELTPSEITTLMDRFHAMGAVSWGFTGGEPLLKEGIDEIIRHGDRLGLLMNMVTNGLLIPQHLDALELLHFIVVSIDGPEEVHERMRAAKGIFQKSMRGIEAARKRGIPVVMQTILSRELLGGEGFDGIDRMIAVARELDVKIMFQRIYYDAVNSEEEYKSLQYSDDWHGRVIGYLVQKRREDPEVFYQSEPEILYMLQSAREKLHCYAGRFYCLIDPLGQVMPCIYKRRDAVALRPLGNDDVRAAFAAVPKEHTCSCYNSCYNRYNHMFGLDLRSVMQTLRGLIRI